MGGYLSSCFWSRYPDISNSVAELSWECVVHFHSSIRQSDRVEAEPSVCALGTDYKMQNFIVVTGWSYPMLFKCLIFNVSFFSIFGNTFTTLTGSGSGSFSFANCYAFRAILSKSWFLLCCSTMLPIKQKKQQQTKTNNQKTPPQNQKKTQTQTTFCYVFLDLFTLVLGFVLCAITDNWLSNTKPYFQFGQSFGNNKARVVEILEGKFLQVVGVSNVLTVIFYYSAIF